MLIGVTGKRFRRVQKLEILPLHGNSLGIVEMDGQHFLNSSSHLVPSHHLSDPSFQVLPTSTPSQFFSLLSKSYSSNSNSVHHRHTKTKLERGNKERERKVKNVCVRLDRIDISLILSFMLTTFVLKKVSINSRIINRLMVDFDYLHICYQFYLLYCVI